MFIGDIINALNETSIIREDGKVTIFKNEGLMAKLSLLKYTKQGVKRQEVITPINLKNYDQRLDQQLFDVIRGLEIIHLQKMEYQIRQTSGYQSVWINLEVFVEEHLNPDEYKDLKVVKFL